MADSKDSEEIKESGEAKGDKGSKTTSLITILSYLAMAYFIVIIPTYIYSHICLNTFTKFEWFVIDSKAFSDFGTHVAGIAAIFAFILVFATYRQQVKINNEQAEYIKQKEAQQKVANEKQEEYMVKKETQLIEQAKTIKQLVNDNKKQSLSQINQLKTLATHIDTMVGNNQNQYNLAIKEKSFYYLLEYFDNTVDNLVLLNDDRVGNNIPINTIIKGKQAVQQTYLDIEQYLKDEDWAVQQKNKEAEAAMDTSKLTLQTYQKKIAFWNNYLNQIRTVLEKIDELEVITNGNYLDLFKSKLSDEEMYMIVYMLLYVEEIKNTNKLIKQLKKHSVFGDFSQVSDIGKYLVKELFKDKQK
ncbi:hypothetical protein ACE193_07980 [Bernardetia sp. OM2101]|uniref:hypothetical protein n=1 Tax=Bernardetia sp. OM2101 TaxID=3344876 RepID=UPI0035CF72FB